MSDLISRQDAIDAIHRALDRETCLYSFVRKVAVDAIKTMPSAQPTVDAVKHGEWIELTDRNERKYSHICSNCHRFHIDEGEIGYYNYCPNCGAKMHNPCADCQEFDCYGCEYKKGERE